MIDEKIHQILHQKLHRALVFNASPLIVLLSKMSQKTGVDISVEYKVDKVVISIPNKVLVDSIDIYDTYGIFLSEDAYEEGRFVEILLMRGINNAQVLDTICFTGNYTRLSEHTECDPRDSE